MAVAPPNLSGEILLSEPFRTLPLAVLALWCGAFEPCRAEPYPTRPIRLPEQGASHEFATFLADEMRKWTPIIEETGFRLE